MGLRINTNVASISAQRALKVSTRDGQETMAKLASGSRITKSADDAAGLAISEKLKSYMRSSAQANRNANDGISMIQVAEGSFNEISSILTRLRESPSSQLLIRWVKMRGNLVTWSTRT